MPGNIDMAKGVIVGWGNMPIFNGYAMRDELSKRLNAKVILENDANAAALGEQWMGAGRGVDDLVLLTLGTGIGGGIIVGGRILHGQIGMAGELGHITISPNGNPCGCGNRGCVEKHASATAVSAMARLLGLGHDLTAKQVYDLAVQGNDRAREIFKVMGEALGIALAGLINIFNFPLYLLGGGVVARGNSSPRRCWRKSSAEASPTAARSKPLRRASRRPNSAATRACTARPAYRLQDVRT